MQRRPRLICALGMVLLIAGGAVVLYATATRHGLGLVGDSADYVRLAAQMREQQRIVLGETHFPPLYPLLLRVVGHEPVMWRLMHALLLAITVTGVGFVAWRITRQLWLTAAVAGGFAFAPDTQLSFALLMSEALFVPLVIAAVALLSAREPRWWRFPFAAIMLGFAALTRHAGLFLAAGLVSALALRAPGMRRRRSIIGIAMMTALFALAPWLAWRLRSAELGAPPSRILTWHPPTRYDLWTAAQTFGGWLAPLAPDPVRGGLGIGLIALLLLLAVRYLKCPRRATRREGPLILMVLVYAAGLLVSRSLLDAATPLAGRLWLPVLPLVLLWLATAARRWARRGWIRPVIVCGIIGLVGLNLHASLVQARRLARDGIGYATPAWAQSPTMAFVAGLPPGTPILTNAADAILLLTGREAQHLPMTRFRTADRVNTRWRRQLIDAAVALRRENGVIVFFDTVDRNDYLVTDEQLDDYLIVEPIAGLPDGTVYRVVAVR